MKKYKKFLKKFKRFKEYILKRLDDIFTILALIIIGINSCFINIYFGFYVIAVELIVVSYVINRYKYTKN